MRLLLVAALALTACRTAPAAPLNAAPLAAVAYDWRRDGGLRNDEADARCREELPACRQAFGIYQALPSPCAHQGTACREVRSKYDGRWSCACDGCASSDDCKPGEHCGTSAPHCSHERAPSRCIAGPPPIPEPCPELAPSSRAL